MHDIYIVGLGIKWIDHITLETDRVLGWCNEILYVENAPAIKEYFLSKSPKATNLTTLYNENSYRGETYKKMASAVINAALSHAPIAFALYGHPMIYAHPPFIVKEVAATLGLTVKVMPGISAMDCIFADLGIDPAINGIQMYEATDIILRNHQLSPKAATLIWQIGSLETALFSTTQSSPQRFTRFKEHMLRFFSSSHPVYAIYCQPHPALKSQVLEFPLGAIEEHSEALHSAITLYIPPAEPARDVDIELIAKLIDVGHLRGITQSNPQVADIRN